jgi:hypothetical protein
VFAAFAHHGEDCFDGAGTCLPEICFH